MTNEELARELRKPGKIEMPVLAGNDTIHMVVEKSDLIAHLSELPATDKAAWDFYLTHPNGVRRLDVAPL